MELVLIILTSTIMSALFFGCYLMGIRHGEKRAADSQKHEYVEVTEDNQEAVKQFLNWINYRG